MKIQLTGVNVDWDENVINFVELLIDDKVYEITWDKPILIPKEYKTVRLELWQHDERHPASLFKVFKATTKEECKQQFLQWYWTRYGMLYKDFDSAMKQVVSGWKSYNFIMED